MCTYKYEFTGAMKSLTCDFYCTAFKACLFVCICVFLHGMANPLTDCFHFREPACMRVSVCMHTMRQIADIYQGVKLISVNCGQVHLHTFLISLDRYQPLSP